MITFCSLLFQLLGEATGDFSQHFKRLRDVLFGDNNIQVV
jgi:hypothetical protein